MRRSYFIIIIVAIALLALGVAAYFFILSNNTGVAVAPPPSPKATSATTLPSAPANASTNVESSGSAGPVIIQATSTNGANGVSGTQAHALVEIDKGPVIAGIVAFDTLATSTATSSVATTTAPQLVSDVEINYLERESGNVFSYLFHSNLLARISNRTIPGVEEADWTPDGQTAFIRYLSGSDNATINTYALPANGQGGFFLPQDIDGLVTGAGGVLSTASGQNGTIGTVERADGTHVAQAFTTALSSLRASFAANGRYLVFTKPSSAIAGYAFLVDGAGDFIRVVGPLNGLVALPSPSGTEALISYSDAGVMETALINLSTDQATPLPLATIADKCVWTADSSAIYCGVPINPSTQYAYPDDWYQGAVSFSDRIWKIDVAGQYAQLVLDFNAQTGRELDATNLSVDPGDTVLAFRNKLDGSLWAYQL